MASLTLQALRQAIRTSIYGSRLGLDTSLDQPAAQGGMVFRGGFLVGMPGIRLPIQKQTTTSPTTFNPTGSIEMGATTGSTITLSVPIPGTEFTVTQTVTSTLGMQVVSSGANFNSSTGSSANSFTLWGQGCGLRLVALSTALWATFPAGQTTAQVSFSTV